MSELSIEYLDWDSQLFDYPVGLILNPSRIDLKSVQDKIGPYRLVYLKSKEKLNTPFFEDVKVSFRLDVTILIKREVSIEGQVESYSGQNLIELISLAMESGKFSRFKLDRNFNGLEFEQLYFQWIINSLKKKIADEVLLIRIDHEIAGFITLKLNEIDCEIGLIATSPKHQRMGVGRGLINSATRFALTRGKGLLSVPTQLSNINAMNFYRKMGFVEVNRTYIYHIWNHEYCI